jgi:hypothetical protein
VNKRLRTDRATSSAGARSTLLLAAVLAALASACGDDGPTAPSSAAVVTFAVGSEEFRVALTTADQVAAARAAQSGGRAKIPIGRIVPGTQVNAGWSWHLEEVTFAENHHRAVRWTPLGRRTRRGTVWGRTVLSMEREDYSD